MGAFIMLHLHKRFPHQVNGMIGVSPAFNFVHNVKNWNSISTYNEVEDVYLCPTAEGECKISREFFNPQLLDQVDLFKEEKAIKLNCPLHILHGMCDDTISWESSIKFVQKQLETSHEVRVIFRKDGNHRLSSPFDIDAMLREIDFMIKQLCSDPPDPNTVCNL